MKDLKTILSIIGLVLIVAVTTHFVTKWKASAKIEYVQENMQKRLDSLSVVKKNAVATREAIEDSLNALDEKFANYVTETRQRILNYTTLVGQLRLEKDALKDSTEHLRGRLALGDLINRDSSVTNTFRDTLITVTTYWSDSLFATDAIASFDNDTLNLESNLRQIRDIRLDIVTTISDDKSQVNTFVHSPDFDSLRAEAVTELEPETKKSWGWAVAAVLLVKEAISILPNLFN